MNAITLNEAECWEAVERSDPQFNGVFVTAVRTTGIYCRPTCTARRPLRKNVEFFATPDQAEAAGYRACKRCRPRDEALHPEPQYDLIMQVCRYLETPQDRLPTLDELAARFALSPYHLQRTFKRIVGVSPRQYADTHRQERMKALLKTSPTVLDVAYAAGYGGSSSFYAGASALGMTPVHYREGGKTMHVTYTVRPCPLGYVLIAATEKGVCAIQLGDSPAPLVDQLREELPNAKLIEADSVAHADGFTAWVDHLLAYLNGAERNLDLPLDIQATAFQRKVWEALRAIPPGSTESYAQVAARIGQPSAARAVASACAANKVALLIPCHRVVREGGEVSGYRWGVQRKHALLEQERRAAGM